MPELPDITVYAECIRGKARGKPLERIRLASPFLLRSVAPQLDSFRGLPLLDVERRGKRLVFAFPGERFLALHLMIAGRLHWKAPGAPVPKGNGLLALDFPEGSLVLTESGTKKRAALHAVQGAAALETLFPVGLEPLEASPEAFAAALRRENHTLKRSLTDPRLFSGIGNAYSDEILHRARLSPVLLTSRIADAEIARLHAATVEVLREWTGRLRAEAAGGFPAKVTAFREGMAVHGRHGLPCPACGTPVQRIRHAENETNYCATCQTGGRLLANRALSSLLRKDWPRSLEEMEKMVGRHCEALGNAADPGSGGQGTAMRRDDLPPAPSTAK
jgi:formamidopyrimidine-DNA glycosylase